MNRDGMGSIGVGALSSGRSGDSEGSTNSPSNAQRGSRSGGGASTFNVYSHLGQGAVESPFSKQGHSMVAPANFYGSTGPITHSHSAGSRSDRSRDSNSRRSFASAGAQAMGGGSPQVSSRRCRSWGGGHSSSVGEALARGTPSAHNQVAPSEAYYRRNRGEGQASREESASLAFTRLGTSGSKIAGVKSPYPCTDSNPADIESSDSSRNHTGNGNAFRGLADTHDTDNNLSSPGPHPMPATSQGAHTSSSVYGSAYTGERAPKYASRVSSDSQCFDGFGAKFGERSGSGSGRGGKGRAKRRTQPGYAPASEGEMKAVLSSNAFASGVSQNCGNFMTGRPSSRVTAPPGGHSTFSLG